MHVICTSHQPPEIMMFTTSINIYARVRLHGYLSSHSRQKHALNIFHVTNLPLSKEFKLSLKNDTLTCSSRNTGKFYIYLHTSHK